MRKKIRRAFFSAVLLGSLLTSSGCGFFADTVVETASTEEEKDLIEVGFSQVGSESVWRTANTESIQNALTRENGFFLIFKNGRQKQENQIKAIRSFIAQRVDYIVLSPVTEEGWDTVLEEAKEAGIPVIIADRMVSVADDSLYTAYVGTDKREEGRKAGLWLESYLKKHNKEDEEVRILVLKGTEGSSAQLGRTMGFDEIADQHDNWTILAQETGDFTTSKGREVMKKLLATYPDFDVLVSQNDDMTFGAIDALESAGITTGISGDVVVISFDAVSEALRLVSEGVINVDVECNPEQGEMIAQVIKALENGEEVEKTNIVEENVFTIGNVGAYLNDRTY